MSVVRLEQVYKRFGDVEVVRDVNLELPRGGLTVFLGPSGCGKTTTLRMIAGLESVSSGRILIGEQDVTHLDPRDRNIAMVFQNYALYPHKTVAENLGFGLKIRGVPQSEIESRVLTASQLLGLSELLARRPKQLSGGQMQRVALGRAIVRDAEVFLLDEPLSNLDAKLRVQMREEIFKLQRRIEKSMIYVTHDQVEAMTLADQIVIMRDGRVQQVGRPLEIFDRPNNLYVAGFVGSPEMNILDMRVEDGMLKGATCSISAERLDGLSGGRQVKVGIRPDHVELALEASSSTATGWLEVEVCEQLGTTTLLIGSMDGQRLRVLVTRTSAEPGDRVPVRLPAERLHLFDADSGARLN
ncbi:ABC transporter ATP-binding protein [Lacisediminimonas profundi]|uniref:ABC transporter ATP-binding protein n=1 Tax=Lacisediminimonas profundi TaxID=2603856 RepID=UPI00124B0E45|nr:ABC transporter ATP-binding protein [Lacisediminimonas profundi]